MRFQFSEMLGHGHRLSQARAKGGRRPRRGVSSCTLLRSEEVVQEEKLHRIPEPGPMPEGQAAAAEHPTSGGSAAIAIVA